MNLILIEFVALLRQPMYKVVDFICRKCGQVAIIKLPTVDIDRATHERFAKFLMRAVGFATVIVIAFTNDLESAKKPSYLKPSDLAHFCQ